jgi:hypothetical protein
MALAQLVAAVIDNLTITNWGAPPDSHQFCAQCARASGIGRRQGIRMVAIDIVDELPNPYDRLKLEMVGSCFALHLAKRSSLSTGSKQKLAPIVRFIPEGRRFKSYFDISSVRSGIEPEGKPQNAEPKIERRSTNHRHPCPTSGQ